MIVHLGPFVVCTSDEWDRHTDRTNVAEARVGVLQHTINGLKDQVRLVDDVRGTNRLLAAANIRQAQALEHCQCSAVELVRQAEEEHGHP